MNNYGKNILQTPLERCSPENQKPNTGYHRDGYCRPNMNDRGKHYVCGKMNEEFMKFTASRNNDLSSVVKPGENWCLCEDRWKEAYDANKAPEVIKNATHENTRNVVKQIILQENFSNINKNNKIDPGNIFFIFGTLFFIDLCFFRSKYTKSLFKIKFFKK